MTAESADALGVPSPDVLVAHLSGEAVLLNLADKRYYRLNESAAFIWKALERGEKRNDVITSIVNSYRVDAETASTQLDAVIRDFANKGLLI